MIQGYHHGRPCDALANQFELWTILNNVLVQLHSAVFLQVAALSESTWDEPDDPCAPCHRSQTSLWWFSSSLQELKQQPALYIVIIRASHVIAKRRSSYLCLGAWIWTGWTRACCIYGKAAFRLSAIEHCLTVARGNQPICRTDCYQVNDMGWMVCGLLVSVHKWSFWLKSWWNHLGAEKIV